MLPTISKANRGGSAVHPDADLNAIIAQYRSLSATEKQTADLLDAVRADSNDPRPASARHGPRSPTD